ncbi:uncharacterized protein LY89DRAFT_160375 [Mollisia scopiformis]|uniref:F-box domain-containing protein n=1 Tax=Mollisia scopiformis TaxID=149040 RepID=A0A194X073_MOLSC|nr:uncharacterized protein LY89DRAFT_160375 [Mollisia scopiformis]KUJ13591.1 hypothetical protein LY89DRAFT_160375 [Mollisia scopiformis]
MTSTFHTTAQSNCLTSVSILQLITGTTMRLLQKLFFWFRKSSDIDASYLLQGLPLDILLCIVAFLPAESAVALSLTCKQLKHLLWDDHSPTLGSSPKAKVALLELLALDLPNFIACSPCGRLHDIENVLWYNSSTYNYNPRSRNRENRLPACIQRDQDSDLDDITYTFGTTAFKMAVKRYHQKPDCKKVLKLMSSRSVYFSKWDEWVVAWREECRVVGGSLMHCWQSVHISSNYSYLASHSVTPRNVRICTHVAFNGSTKKSGICCRCRTEWRIDSKYYNLRGRAVFLTWKDLGTGPESEVFRQHNTYTPESSFLRYFFTNRQEAQAQTQTHSNQLPAAVGVVGDLSSAFGDGNLEFDSWLDSRSRKQLFQYQDIYRAMSWR